MAHNLTGRCMTRRATITVVAIAFLGVCAWGADVWNDRQFVVAVEAPTQMYERPPHEYPKSNPTVATLKRGEALRVLRVRYGKDFEAFKVETTNGQIGWVVGGEGVRVLSR